jgi:hypothetical protein
VAGFKRYRTSPSNWVVKHGIESSAGCVRAGSLDWN